eukprot:TRINITY_DN7657_c0_g1_i1.p1 TRINITY_DN7657_c0_g1~~TRINITY_DN7657_c0_g1_i1.p1  ORF type:complete len:300 (-),score=54.84 TRINITY_DN7657_c0_g1_i1:3-902(-)
MERKRFAGVEAGGESFKVAIAEGEPSNIIETQVFPTTTPDETIPNIIGWLKSRQFDSLGIACFGPIDLDTNSSTYGYITTTPKKKWQNTDILGPFKIFNCPTAFDTDVNAPAAAHQNYNNAKTSVYVTVGTGVGVGLVVEGQPVHGILHPEMGHYFVPRSPNDTFEPTCDFHGGCLEGFVASGALSKRFGVDRTKLAEIPDSHDQWDHIAFYLAQLCITLILTVSPHVIVLGGGVMNRKILFPKIRTLVRELLNGYLKVDQITDPTKMDKYIVESPFGNDAGIIGALQMAKQILNCNKD